MTKMLQPQIVKSVWRGSIVLFCLFFPFTIAYSQIALGVAVVFWIVDWIQTGEKRIPKHERIAYGLIGLYISLNLLSGLVNGTFFLSANILKEHWLFLAIPVVADGLNDQRWRPRIIGAILLSVSVAGSYGIWQHFSGYSIRNHALLNSAPSGSGFRAWGNFHQTLTYGNVMAVASAFAIGLSLGKLPRMWKIFAILAAGLGMAGAALSYCRGPILGLVAAVIAAIIIISRKSWKHATLAVGLAVVIGYFVAPNLAIRFQEVLPALSGQELSGRAKTVSRITIWRMGWSIAKDNPVFGVGPGNFHREYVKRAGDSLKVTFNHAHNDVLDIAAFAGAPAALTYLGLWALVALVFLRAMKKLQLQNSPTSDFLQHPILLGAFICSLTFAICSLTEATFADEEVRVSLMLFWGLGFWATRSVK